MQANTYLNPVYPGSFPDPFVLKYGGEYYGYCTGIQPDGRCFGILHSPDLVHWEALAGALEPLPGGHTMYWAPEVLVYNGLFYMYYSVGNETFMEIRVAVAEQPAGPFEDSGRTLTTQQFAIDAHVFKDDNGKLYLFYATDFLEHSHIGTGTVVDRLLDPFTPEGKPRPVTRARYDWQVYDPNRAEKGGVRWHTIEGSFVLKHHNRYYQMFSGGNWQNLSYGVSYALSDNLDQTEEWDQVADGEKVLPVLRTIPGKVVGPGHNSVVRGPDNRQLYCVYHRWSEGAKVREMAIDPLDWAGERLIVMGPSFEPQPFPTQPFVSGFGNFPGETESSSQSWTAQGGDWQFNGNTLFQNNTEEAAVCFRLDYRYFLLEVELKAVENQPGRFGFGLNSGEAELFSFLLEPGNTGGRLTWLDEDNSTQEQILSLPENFNPTAYHLLRLEVQARQVSLRLDGMPVNSPALTLGQEADCLRLISLAAPAAFTGFALTPGFEDPFPPVGDRLFSDWQPGTATAAGEPDRLDPVANSPIFTKGDPLENYELVLNVLLDAVSAGETSFYPAWNKDRNGPKLSFQQVNDGWTLQVEQGEAFPLPADCDPKIHQQFRFRKLGQRLVVLWENHSLGELEVTPDPANVGLPEPTGKTFEMVRVTAL